MGTTTKDRRRISGGYNQKERTNMGRKLENKRRRTQRRVEKIKREDDGQNADMHVISAQKVLFSALFKIGFECFLRTNHIN